MKKNLRSVIKKTMAHVEVVEKSKKSWLILLKADLPPIHIDSYDAVHDINTFRQKHQPFLD